jgi:hypothetical protein
VTVEHVIGFAALLATHEGLRRDCSEYINVLLQAVNSITPIVRERVLSLVADRIGVLCLSSVCDSSLMWSHYADGHRGFVIGMNQRSPWFDRPRADDDCYQLLEIEYGHPAASVSLLELGRGTQMKAPEWSYEREWRMCAPLEDADQVTEKDGEAIYLFSIPPECISEIILGSRTTTAMRGALSALVSEEDRYKHVSISRAELDEKTASVQIVRA